VARIHNGGPNGYKISGTVGYWGKVSKELKDQGADEDVINGTAKLSF
jgi:hypothetical protein